MKTYIRDMNRPDPEAIAVLTQEQLLNALTALRLSGAQSIGIEIKEKTPTRTTP